MRRKYFLTTLIAAAVMLVAPLLTAFAQDMTATDPAFDWTQIFSSALMMSVFVVTVVQYLRSHVWKALDGWMVNLVTLGLSVGLSLLGYFTQMAAFPDLKTAIGFGISAAIMATGGVSLSAQLMTKRPVGK